MSHRTEAGREGGRSVQESPWSPISNRTASPSGELTGELDSKESTSRDRVEKLVRAKVLTAPNWGLGRDDGTSLLELGIELAIDASSGIQLWRAAC